MFFCARTTGCNHWNGNIVCNLSGQFNIIPCLCSIAVHAGQKNFSRTKSVSFYCPFYSVKPGINTTAVFVNIPATSILSSSGINGDYHTLAAKLVRCISNQLRCIDCGRINGNLVGTFPKQYLKILHRTDTTAYRKRDKHLLCNLTHHVYHRCTVIGRCGNIQKDYFICARLVVSCCDLYRISGIS